MRIIVYGVVFRYSWFAYRYYFCVFEYCWNFPILVYIVKENCELGSSSHSAVFNEFGKYPVCTGRFPSFYFCYRGIYFYHCQKGRYSWSFYRFSFCKFGFCFFWRLFMRRFSKLFEYMICCWQAAWIGFFVRSQSLKEWPSFMIWVLEICFSTNCIHLSRRLLLSASRIFFTSS